MEYNLLKTFETNFGYSGENDIFSDDLVLPGIGQVLNFNSLIVPLHNAEGLTAITKQSDFEIDQLGAGIEAGSNEEENDNDIDASLENSANGIQTKTQVEDSDLLLNERKRKQLDSSIYQSFMHPKMFKTKKINVDKTSIKIPKEIKSEQKKIVANPINGGSVKKVKHKFTLY